MSTGADCRFIQAADGTWTYELQNWPYGENPDYTSYGPFTKFDDAYSHLHDNHANPGGYRTIKHPDVTCPHDDLKRFDYPKDGLTHECRRCGDWLKR